MIILLPSVSLLGFNQYIMSAQMYRVSVTIYTNAITVGLFKQNNICSCQL